MLRGIHQATSTFVGKTLMTIVMGALVVAFAIWGIGDIFRGYGRNDVAKVGSAEISVEQFREYYNSRLQRISQQIGKPLSPDQARAAGLDRQILGQMIAETTLDQQAKNMRLGLNNASVAKSIESDPTFNGPNGKFNRQRFEEIIRNAGFTEARFVAEQRNVMLRRQIAESISGNMTVPQVAIKAIDRYRTEKRDVSYMALGPDQAGTIATPSADTLKKYYEAHKALFRAPEYRRVTLVSLSPAALANPATVTDAQAKAYYDQHKAQYGKPEKREVRQILFKSEAAAKAAREKIANGATFDDIIKARGLKPSDTNIGMVTQAQIIDPAVAKTAFALKSGEVSQPVKGNFGTVLVTVGKIEPGEQKTFQEVEPQIKKHIAEQNAVGKIGDLRDKIEDEKASGATLAEAAKKLGLKTRVIAAVDRAGNGPDGKPIPNLPKKPDVVNAAFTSDVGVDNEALQLPSGGYLYYDVTGITPSHERAYDTVKDKVEKNWRDDEIAKRLKAKAKALLAKLKAGSTLKALADADKVQVQSAAGVQRGSPGFAPGPVVRAAFGTPKDVPGMTQGEKETEYYLFKVTKVTDPKFVPTLPAAQAIAQQLKNAYSDDIIGAYVAKLENEMGVSINQTALNQVVGGGGAGG
jgi:peptidyl-prolyl cis-trans isomerase D